MNTSYWRNKIMDDMYGAVENQFWVGLSSSAPTDAGGNVTEPVGNGYSRVQIPTFTQAVNGTVKNASDIVFPISTGTWFPADSLATHWVVFDGSGANAHVLSSGTLEVAIGIWKNTVVTIQAEKVIISLMDYTE